MNFIASHINNILRWLSCMHTHTVWQFIEMVDFVFKMCLSVVFTVNTFHSTKGFGIFIYVCIERTAQYQPPCRVTLCCVNLSKMRFVHNTSKSIKLLYRLLIYQSLWYEQRTILTLCSWKTNVWICLRWYSLYTSLCAYINPEFIGLNAVAAVAAMRIWIKHTKHDNRDVNRSDREKAMWPHNQA